MIPEPEEPLSVTPVAQSVRSDSALSCPSAAAHVDDRETVPKLILFHDPVGWCIPATAVPLTGTVPVQPM
jgi:hypothetical protein